MSQITAGELQILLGADTARLRADMDRADRITQQAERNMSQAADRIKSAFAAIGAGLGLAALVQMSDAYAKFTAQLRLATVSAREYAAAYADVKRIANAAQQDLASTGTLYARIANGTRELGTSQKQVAAITETVNLALKVSGAAASESASAQLQLSQAFASGTLRGEEFNAVNEAAPRLMLALADGIGVPVGALKKMAEEGKITSKVMADVLPGAVEKLRVEAAQVQTIAGAFQVLKNNVLEFVGVQANASGVVSTLTGAIGFLAENLAFVAKAAGLVAGALLTATAVRTSNWLVSLTTDAIAAASAKRALAAATLANAVTTTEAAAAAAAAKLAEAQANVRATASAAALAATRVTELRAAVQAAQGAVALAIATNGLIPAQARAIALAEAHAVALSAQAVAGNAATTTAVASAAALRAQAAAGTFAAGAMGALRGALAFLGGPLGLIITLLGAGATAWAIWGDKGSKAEKQVADTLAEEIDEYIANLNRQIEKLKERNELAGKGMTTTADPKTDFDQKREKILAEINRISKMTDVDITARTAMLQVWGDRLNKLTNDTEEHSKALQRNKDLTFDAKYAEWQGKNGTAAQKQAYELAKLREEYGRVTPAMKAYVEAKYADKDAEKKLKKEATAYENLMESINKTIATYDLEIKMMKQGMPDADKRTESQKLTIALNAEEAKSKGKLNPEHIKEARARIAIVEAREQEIKAAKDDAEWARISSAANADNLETLSKLSVQLRNEALAQDDYNARIGLSKVAIAELDAARLEHIATIKEENAEIAEGMDLTGERAEIYRQQAKDLRARAAGIRVGASKESDIDVTSAKEMLDILTAIDSAAKSAATGMEQSFGRVGKAIGGLTTSLSGYAVQQQAIAAQLLAIQKDQTKTEQQKNAATAAAMRANAQAQIKSYGDMAGAAKSFFKEGTTGYKVLEGTEKAFRAFEMGMAVKSMVEKSGLLTAFTSHFVASKATQTTAEATSTAASNVMAGSQASAWGVTAVVKAIASMPFPANIAAGAATLAAVIAIGAKMAGGVSGSGGATAAQVQEKQGTGTVFGDKSAKSDSIRRSIELLEDHSNELVPINRSMLASLQSIDAAMGGLTNLVIRTTGVTDGSFAPSGTKVSGSSIVDSTRFFGGIGPMGDIMGKLASAILGKTTRTIVDAGIQFGGSVRGLQAGQGYNQYASVDTTKSSLFGLVKKTSNATETQALSSDLTNQFALIFKGVESALTGAAQGLGVGADHVTKTLDALTIDVTKLSLKGLTGDALTDAINAVISKTMDEMSSAVFPEMEKFRQVGEGYTETVVRLAANYASLDATLRSIGGTFGATGIDSLTAREGLLALAGGLDKLNEQVASYADNFLTEAERLAPVQAYVTQQMAALGYAGVTTRDGFKEAVNGLITSGALATESGAATFAGLMQVGKAFAEVYPAIKLTGEAAMSAADILNQKEDLQDRYDQATMTSMQLREKERATIATANKPLFDSIMAIEDKKKSDELALELMQAQGRHIEVLNANRAKELALLSDADKVTKAATYAAQDRAKTDGLTLELLTAQGRSQEVLNLQRAAELATLSDADKIIKQQTYAAQDKAKTDSLTIELLNAQGRSYEALNIQRANELATLSEGDRIIKSQTFAAQDKAKSDALALELLNASGDAIGALNVQRANELATLSAADQVTKRLTYAAQDKAKTDSLVLELMGAQGDTLGVLNAQRARELALLSEDDAAIKRKTYAAQDKAKSDSLALELMTAQGRTLEVLNIQRANELKNLSEADRLTKIATFAAQDRAKSDALAIELMSASGDVIGALNAQRAAELAGLSAADQVTKKATYAAQDKAKSDALAVELMSASGDVLGALNAQRAAELAGLSAADQATKKLTYAAQDKSKTDALQLDLLNAQGNSIQALNVQRAAELAALSEGDRIIKAATFAAQDKAKTDALALDLMRAQGKSNEVLAATRRLELSTLSATDQVIKQMIFDQEDANNTRALTIKLLEAQGKSEEALNMTREDVLATLSETDAALQKQIWAAEKARAASEAAIEAAKKAADETLALYKANQEKMLAFQKSERDLQIQLMEAMGNAEAALAARRQDALAAMDAGLHNLQKSVWAAQDALKVQEKARGDLQSAYERETGAARALKDQMLGLVSSFASYAGELRDSALTPEQRLAKAKGEFESVSALAAGGSADALGKLQDVARRYLDAVNAIQGGVSGAQGLLESSYQRESSALQGVIDKHRQYSDQLKSLRDSLTLGTLSSLSPQAKYNEARRQLATAGPEQLQGAITTFLEASRAFNATSAPYAEDEAWARSLLDAAITGADQQLTEAQKQLVALDKQVEGLISVQQAVVSVSDAIAALGQAQTTATNGTTAAVAQVLAALQAAEAAAQGQADGAQAQLDLLAAQVTGLLDINTSVLSVTDAVKALQAAMVPSSVSQAAPTALAPGLHEIGGVAKWISASGEDWNRAGLKEQWQAAADAGPAGLAALREMQAKARRLGMTGSDFDALVGQDGVAKHIATSLWAAGGMQGLLPAFANGGDHLGGFALVGEEGPEVVNMGAARVFNARQTKEIMSGSGDEESKALLARIEALLMRIANAPHTDREAVAELRALNRRMDALERRVALAQG